MKLFTLHLLLAGALCFSVCRTEGQSAPIRITGHVFIDKNSNGLRDNHEQGLKDVVVSDQVQLATTNVDGAYSLMSNGHMGTFFVVQPEGYVIAGSWWAKIPDQPNAVINFPLIAATKSTSFTFIHASDTHVSEQSLARLERLRVMTDSIKPAFVLVTGDLIKDALRVPEQEATKLYEMYRSAIGKFSVPVWNVPGNHELFGIERHKSLVSEHHALYGKNMYRHHLGPDYYSFNYGGLHFIGLNSVDYHDLWYYGHIDSLQMEWIKKDISTVGKTKPIITFNHIPFFSGGMSMGEYTDGEPGSTLIAINGTKQWRHVVTNADKIMEMMQDHNFPVALSGHYHFEQQFKFESAQHTEFHQTGAVVGPSTNAGMVMPSGFILYTVSEGKIRSRKFIEIK